MIIKKSLLQQVLGAVCALIVSILLVVTFVDSKYVPSWSEIFQTKVSVDETADIITVLDVGQGDCALIQSNGRFALIDTGDGKSVEVARILKKQGVLGLDALILSHWHSDHAGGTAEILNSFEVTNAVVPQVNSEDEEIDELASEILNFCDAKGVSVHTAITAMVINVGDIELTVLQANYDLSDENNRSLIIMAKCEGKKYLFTGDSENLSENLLLESGIDFDCDILKVSHHGSNSSTSKKFLEVCTPDISVISVGAKNSYGHPSNAVINRIKAVESGIYRTDFHGNISITFSEGNYSISTQY